MSPTDIARLFGVRRIGSGRKWRARCPVHKSRGLTLAIYDDGGKAGVHCHAGCDQAGVLAAVGLTWRDLKPLAPTNPAAMRLAALQRQQEELARKLHVLLERNRIAGLERWSRIAAALAWHLLRNPRDTQVDGWYEEALSRCEGNPSPWPKQAPYCPFPLQKLLHNIKSSQATPEIARYLKLGRGEL